MKSLQNQYNDIKKRRGSKDIFLKEAKRLYPQILPNHTNFNDAVKLLVEKNIISKKNLLNEQLGSVVSKSAFTNEPNFFKTFQQSLKEFEDNDSIQIGTTLRIPIDLTTDPINKQGEEGKVIAITKEGDVVVEFEDGKVGTYQSDVFGMEDEYDMDRMWDKDDYDPAGGHGLSSYVENKSSMLSRKLNEAKKTKAKSKKKKEGYDYSDKDNVDNVYGMQFLQGFYMEMNAPENEKKSIDDIKKIVAKNLKADVNFYVKNGQFGIKGAGYVEAASSKTDQMEPLSKEKPKANVKAGKKENKKGTPKGVTMMKEALRDINENDDFSGSDPRRGNMIKSTGFDWERKNSTDKAIEVGNDLPDAVEALGFEKMSDDRHYNLSGFKRITPEIEDKLDAEGFYVKDEVDEYDEDRGWMYYYNIELKENFINEINKISENFSEEDFDLIWSEVDVVRKPHAEDEVDAVTDFHDLSPKIIDLLLELPVIDISKEEFDEMEDGFYADNIIGEKQFAILHIGNNYYFVDTQGYPYARYVGKITNFPGNTLNKISEEFVADEGLEMAKNYMGPYSKYIDINNVDFMRHGDEGAFELEFYIEVPHTANVYTEDIEKYVEDLNDYRGPGQSFTKAKSYELDKTKKFTIIFVGIDGGYDI